MTRFPKIFFEALQGQWQFERKIEDYLLGSAHQASGSAVWQTQDDARVLLYTENGHLAINAHRYAFMQSYYYKFSEDRLDILFADGVSRGKLFLSFELNDEHRIMAEHHCKKDHYLACFTLPCAKNLALTISFQVRGPKKQYDVQTFYTK